MGRLLLRITPPHDADARKRYDDNYDRIFRKPEPEVAAPVAPAGQSFCRDCYYFATNGIRHVCLHQKKAVTAVDPKGIEPCFTPDFR